MAQTNIRKTDAATYGGAEGTYGTGATTARLSPVSDSWEHKLTRDDIPVDCESVELYDAQSGIQGLKRGTCNFALYVRPVESAVLASGTVTYSEQVKLMKAWFGGASPATGASVGTTCAVSPGTATAPEVASASNLTAGQWALFPVAGSTEPGCIKGISGTTLTLNPGLSDAPTGSGAVSNLVNLYPTPGADSCSSYTFEHTTQAGTSNQVRLLGCVGDFEWTFKQNETLTCMVSARAADWARGSLSLAVTAGADTGGTPFALADGAKFLLQDATTATATHVPFEEITFRTALGLTHVPDMGGVIQGTAGIMRTGERMFAEAVVTLRTDESIMTRWAAQTVTQLALMIPSGTGTARQWVVFHMPRCVISGKPTRVYSSDKRERYAVTFRSQIDSSLGSALLKAPFIHAV